MQALRFGEHGHTTALVLGAHPDDEMGCAGLISRLVDEGADVHHYYFSECSISTTDRGFAPAQLLAECEQSRDILGIPAENRGSFDYPVRNFPEHRQAILDDLIDLRRNIAPTLVLTAARGDVHQDHSTLTQEAVRAFKNVTIFGFELPWNLLSMAHDVFVTLDASHIERKMLSIQQYQSQIASPYADPDFPKHLARTRGTQCGTTFAECYELVRAIL